MKCIYIDPPYNTGQAMEHYDDGLEHSIWLSLMLERFHSLRNFLRADGVFLGQLNDEEMAYAKVLLDEAFGRCNFLNHVSVRMKQTAGASGGGEDKRLKKNTEHILIYARDKDGSGEQIDVCTHNGVMMRPISALADKEGLTEQECYKKYFDRVFRDANAQSSIRTRVMNATLGEGDFFSIEYVPRSGRRKGQKISLYYKGANCDPIAWLSDVAVKRRDRLVKLERAGTYWKGFPLNNLTKEGDLRVRSAGQSFRRTCSVPARQRPSGQRAKADERS